MTIRVQDLDVSVPGVRAFRWACDERYTSMKSFYAVARVEHGQGEYRSVGRTWRTGPGTVVLKQPGDVHCDTAHGRASTIQVVVLPTREVEAVASKLRVPPQLAANDERGAAFHHVLDAVAHHADRFALETAITEAIAAFAALDTPAPHPPAIRRAIELLRAHLPDPIRLDALAAAVGLDKFHLCHAFRAEVGLPPYAYLTHLRIHRAKALLRAGTPPRDVAPQVGLYDQSQLNRHFRRIVGTTPGEFQRRAG